MADDDPDDRALFRDAFDEGGTFAELRTVNDGEELLEYLRQEKRYEPPASAVYPALILLDLNMPRMDGREVLAAMKSDPGLRRIPVIVLSTSSATEDVAQCYDLGANAYIAKPVTFGELTHAMGALVEHWLKVVTLAPRPSDEVKADPGPGAAAAVKSRMPHGSNPPHTGIHHP